MEYKNQYLESALPPGEPNTRYVPHAVLEEIENFASATIEAQPNPTENRQLVHRSKRWTYALFSEMSLMQWSYRPPPPPFGALPFGLSQAGTLFERCAIGLFDKETERYGFGIILTSPIPMLQPFEPLGSAYFPRLGATVPIGLRFGSNALHALPHPGNATASCWAKCRLSQHWGILTAGHAVTGVQPGGSLAFTNGHIGQLSRSVDPPVDAAFVMTAAPARPVAPKPLPVFQFPAAGQPVKVSLQKAAAQRTIVATMNTLGVVRTTAFAVMSFIDQPFVAGDSGALVSDLHRHALGIYLGSMTTQQAPGGVVGLVQNFQQAVYVLDVDPHL